MVSSKQRRYYNHNQYTPRSSTQFQLLGRLRWTYIGTGFIVILVLYMLFATWLDTHGGAMYTDALCKEFQSLRLSGKLCSELCRDRTLQLYNFIKDDNGYRIFEWRGKLYKVDLRHIRHLEENPHAGLQHVYAKPSEGTTFEEFRNLVEEMVTSKLGHVNHKELLNRLLDAADVNKDSKISLGEAKTMWALLQHNEVFTLFLFWDSEYIQQFQGHCGDLYAIENVQNEYLYHKSKSLIVQFLLPYKHTWWLPTWSMRAKTVVGLLEFTLDAYQHGSLGTFAMCGVDETTIGYTKHGDVKITHVGGILSQQELADAIGEKPCVNSSDCVFSEHCVTVCDAETKRCTAQLVKPNLSRVCGYIRPYITKGAPRMILGDLLHTLDKCDHLEYGQEKLDLNHSLILNDLKLLIWKQISNS